MIEQKDVNEILRGLLSSHGLDTSMEGNWFVPNDSLPAIQAIWYPSAENGRLDIQVLLATEPKKILIIECFAGIGEGRKGLLDAFQNFILNSFHVLLSALWEKYDSEQVIAEVIETSNSKYEMYIGNFGTRASPGYSAKVPPELFTVIKSSIQSEILTEEYYWVRSFFCNIGNTERIFESLLNNEEWKAGVESLKNIQWEESEGYYSVRSFVVLKKFHNKSLQHRSASLHWTVFKSRFYGLLRKIIHKTTT